jgi:hypothetical protein
MPGVADTDVPGELPEGSRERTTSANASWPACAGHDGVAVPSPYSIHLFPDEP